MPHPFLSHSKNISLPCVEYSLRHQSSQYSSEKETCLDYHKLSHRNGSYASSLNKQITPPYGITSSPKNCVKLKCKFNWRKFNVNVDHGITEASPVKCSAGKLPVLICSEKVPRQRSNFAACCDDQNLYIQGGVGHNVSYRDFWKFNFATRVWTEIFPSTGMPSGCPLLRDHCMIHYGNRIFIIGGNLVDLEIPVPLWCYDLSECSFVDTFSSAYHGNEHYYPCAFGQRSKNSTSAYRLPSNLTSHSAVLWNNNIVIFGGYKHIYGCSGELWMLNLSSYQWKLLYVAKNETNSSFGKNKGPPPLYKHKAFVSGDEMFVLFGRRSNGTFSDDLWTFHFESMQWRKKSQSGQIPPNLTDSDVQIIGDLCDKERESDHGQSVCCVVGGKDENGDSSRFSYLMSLSDCKWSRFPVESDAFALCGAALLSVPSSTCLNAQGDFIIEKQIQRGITATHTSSSCVGNIGGEDDTASQTRHVFAPLKGSSNQTNDSQFNRSGSQETKHISTEATLGLNGLINVPRGSTLYQSIDLLPKSNKKITTFQNSLFDASNFSNKQQNTKASEDYLTFGAIDYSEVGELDNDAVLDSFCSFGSSSLLLRSSSTLSRSVPRLDKFHWSQDPLDPYSLRSSESNNYISADSLVPILSQGCATKLVSEKQSANENNDKRGDSRHGRFVKRAVQVSDMPTSYKQSGYDNACYLNDSFDNPLFYRRQRSEISHGTHQTSWDATTGSFLLLIGGFDENFIPGRTQGLELSYCHIDAGSKTSSKAAPLCNENDNLETRL